MNLLLNCRLCPGMIYCYTNVQKITEQPTIINTVQSLIPLLNQVLVCGHAWLYLLHNCSLKLINFNMSSELRVRIKFLLNQASRELETFSSLSPTPIIWSWGKGKWKSQMMCLCNRKTRKESTGFGRLGLGVGTDGAGSKVWAGNTTFRKINKGFMKGWFLF